MKLAEWLQVRGVSQRQFAERIGRSAATVSRIVNGIDRPDWRTMDAILCATGGEVRPDDFIAQPSEAAE